MKSILILVAAMICSLAGYSQTTLEEYNYLTKGYKIQIESGLDMKKGYRMVELHDHGLKKLVGKNAVKFEMGVRGLYRDKEVAPCAILVIFHRSDRDKESFICIPHWKSEQEIWNLFYAESNNFSQEGAQAMMWALAKSSSFFAQNN